eukprot:UN08486
MKIVIFQSFKRKNVIIFTFDKPTNNNFRKSKIYGFPKNMSSSISNFYRRTDGNSRSFNGPPVRALFM